MKRHTKRNMLLAANIDNIDNYRKKYIESVNSGNYDFNKHLNEIKYNKQITNERHVKQYLNWCTNRMRYAWHPQAKSYVYAYAYKCFSDNLKFTNILGQNEWFDYGGLVKIGSSTQPNIRQKSHINEITKRELDLKSKINLDCCLLIIPCLKANASEYLETLIHSSIPEENQFNGEWYHDNFGVAKILLSWFFSCRACQL